MADTRILDRLEQMRPYVLTLMIGFVVGVAVGIGIATRWPLGPDGLFPGH